MPNLTAGQPAPTMAPTPWAQPPLTIEQSARAAGGAVWAELALYEVLGSCARRSVDPATKIYLDTCSQHHAWRAKVWDERLGARLVQAYPGPSLPQPPPDLASAPTSATEAAFGALGELGDDAARLAAYERVVLPRMALGYEAWMARCSSSSDRPISRLLAIVLADIWHDQRDGVTVLTRLLAYSGDGAVDQAADGCRAVERHLRQGLYLVGPGTGNG